MSEAAEPDFYYEGPYVVFTAAYHLRRGFCCGSGCRHCPYGFGATAPLPEQQPVQAQQPPPAPQAPGEES